MRDIFLLVGVIVIAFFIRSGCERRGQDSIAKDCTLVCADIGFDHDYAVKRGVFSYECKCKRKKEPVKMQRQR